MNSINLIGRLTRDPELKYTGSGKAVCNFGLAVNEGKDSVMFVDVECWEKTAEMAHKWFRKGRMIGVTGRLRQDEWEDKHTGKKRSRHFVIMDRISFAEPKGDADGNRKDAEPPARSGGRNPRRSGGYSSGGPHQPVDQADIPF